MKYLVQIYIKEEDENGNTNHDISRAVKDTLEEAKEWAWLFDDDSVFSITISELQNTIRYK